MPQPSSAPRAARCSQRTSRNLDPDCSHNAELKCAPNVSDGVESGFGCFDYALDKTKSPVESSTVVGHAIKMKAF